MNRRHVKRSDLCLGRHDNPTKRSTQTISTTQASSLCFGAAETADSFLSDLQWVTLWAQIYGAELADFFSTPHD